LGIIIFGNISGRLEVEVVQKLTLEEIRRLGFDWPKSPLIDEHCVVEAGVIDLTETVARMRSGRAFYRRQLDEAFAFKMRHGADYSDFTDRFDEYARLHRQLGEGIAYLEGIIQAAK
jgi:hypothetical protein